MKSLTSLQEKVLTILKSFNGDSVTPQSIHYKSKELYGHSLLSYQSQSALKKLEKIGLIKRNILNPHIAPANRKSTYQYITN